MAAARAPDDVIVIDDSPLRPSGAHIDDAIVIDDDVPQPRAAPAARQLDITMHAAGAATATVPHALVGTSIAAGALLIKGPSRAEATRTAAQQQLGAAQLAGGLRGAVVAVPANGGQRCACGTPQLARRSIGGGKI